MKPEPPIQVFTERKPDGTFVANAIVKVGATGWGKTERAAIRSALDNLSDALDDELDRAGRRRPTRVR